MLESLGWRPLALEYSETGADLAHSRGLRVIGIYHHKSSEPLHLADVKKYAKEFGFNFPIAIDPDWKIRKQ